MSDYVNEAIDESDDILRRAEEYDATSFSLAERISMAQNEAAVDRTYREAYAQGYSDGVEDAPRYDDEEDDDDGEDD